MEDIAVIVIYVIICRFAYFGSMRTILGNQGVIVIFIPMIIWGIYRIYQFSKKILNQEIKRKILEDMESFTTRFEYMQLIKKLQLLHYKKDVEQLEEDILSIAKEFQFTKRIEIKKLLLF